MDQEQRAYSILAVKALDEAKRIIRGVATTPSVDRVGDIIDPMGVTAADDIPLLHQHDRERPIGRVRLSKPTKAGVNFEAELPLIDEPGPLRDRIETAWGEIAYGLVRAVSIGFRPIEYKFLDDGVLYTRIEVIELSAVTIPANYDAVLTAVKAIDRQSLQRAQMAAAPKIPARPRDPAATGKSVRVVRLVDEAPERASFVINTIIR